MHHHLITTKLDLTMFYPKLKNDKTEFTQKALKQAQKGIASNNEDTLSGVSLIDEKVEEATEDSEGSLFIKTGG